MWGVMCGRVGHVQEVWGVMCRRVGARQGVQCDVWEGGM